MCFFKVIERARYCYFENKIKNLDIHETAVFKGVPILQVHKDASIVVGENVTINSINSINSINYGYHVSMYSPVKIMADRPGAKITIGNNSRIHGSCFHAYSSIYIGSNCLVAANCQIIDCNGHSIAPNDRLEISEISKPVIIEDDVWLCTGVVVLPGVRIGRGSIVSANVVVRQDVPEYSLLTNEGLTKLEVNPV